MICTQDAASHFVKTTCVSSTLSEAADYMERHSVGFLPVMRGGEIVGVVTDRDIALRAAKFPLPYSQIMVADVMTPKVVTISDHAAIAQAAEVMAQHSIRRLVVVDRSGRIAGVLSLDDLAVYTGGDQTVGQILQKMVKPHSDMHISRDFGGDAIVAGSFSRAA